MNDINAAQRLRLAAYEQVGDPGWRPRADGQRQLHS